MSYTITVNRKCSRCPRTESTEISAEDVMKLAKSGEEPPQAFSVSIEDVEVGQFDHLCSVCRTIVMRYIDCITKKPKHQSALREKGRVEVEVDDDEAAA